MGEVWSGDRVVLMNMQTSTTVQLNIIQTMYSEATLKVCLTFSFVNTSLVMQKN